MVIINFKEMENIKEKYDRLRSTICNGDIILFTGKSIASKIIMNCDNNADWSHIEIVTKTAQGRLQVQGANFNGVHPEYLSWRLNLHTDFYIISPNKNIYDIEIALENAFSKVELDIKYDFINGGKELLNRKFNIHIPIKITDKLVCSYFVRSYAIELGLVTKDFEKILLPFPQDFIRFMNIDNIKK